MTTNETTYRELIRLPGYRFGDDGSFWSNLRGNWRRLRPQANGRGQLRVAPRVSGKTVDSTLARLILEAFVGPCPPGMECCHRDDNPANNRLDNLRWDTHRANAAEAIRNGRQPQIGSGHHATALTEADVATIRSMRAEGAGPVEIARLYGMSHQAISKLCRGGSWKHVPSVAGG